MKTQDEQIHDDINSTFVNVTISAKIVDGKYPLYDLKRASEGDWIMSDEVAKKIKWIFPVRRNRILGVFEVDGFQSSPDQKTGNNRVRFDLKMIFEGSARLTESATEALNSTHYVTKHFKI